MQFPFDVTFWLVLTTKNNNFSKRSLILSPATSKNKRLNYFELFEIRRRIPLFLFCSVLFSQSQNLFHSFLLNLFFVSSTVCRLVCILFTFSTVFTSFFLIFFMHLMLFCLVSMLSRRRLTMNSFYCWLHQWLLSRLFASNYLSFNQQCSITFSTLLQCRGFMQSLCSKPILCFYIWYNQFSH